MRDCIPSSCNADAQPFDIMLQICGLSHAGHVAGLTPHGPLYTVTDQVQHKADYLRARLAQDPSRRLVLVGHSMLSGCIIADMPGRPELNAVRASAGVGAYVCLQLLKILPPDNIAAVWCLYPTVMHIAKSPNGVNMTPYFSHHKAAASILGSLAYLPGFLKRAVLRIALTREQACGYSEGRGREVKSSGPDKCIARHRARPWKRASS